MLKYVPIYGSVLLTILIVWIVVQSRRKIHAALEGTYIRSTCCGATTTPIGWTQDGWTSRCDECHAWQYLGDDHGNPPPGFNVDGRPTRYATGGLVKPAEPLFDMRPLLPGEKIVSLDSRRLPAPRPSAANGPTDEGQFVGRPTPDEPEVTSEHPFNLVEPSMAERDAMFDEGEPLTVPPPPNIGGEGHPAYAGPHYIVPHDRFVPYDVLRDPLPGSAVHIVGNVACVGPLEVEEGQSNGTLDSSREEQDRV